MATYKYKFQLYDAPMGGVMAGPAITGSGGSVIVAKDADPSRASLTDKDGVALTQPVALTRGGAEFYTTETSVDLFILCPDGQCVQMYSVEPDGLAEIRVDRQKHEQLMVFPLTYADDTADNTETDMGWDEPTGAVFHTEGAGIKVTTVDATETIDVGTLSTDTGDADGFLSAVSVATAGVVLDNGALLADAASAHVSAGKSITFTFSAGVDTAKLYVFLPYTLLNTGFPTIT